MPFQKSFNIVLEESTAENEYIALNGTDSTGALNADSRVLGVDASKSEAKPSFLSEAADGSGDYAKESVTASNSGWIMKPGSPATGNDNTAAQPEVLVCVRQLKDSIDVPTAPQLTIGNTSSKTTFFQMGIPSQVQLHLLWVM